MSEYLKRQIEQRRERIATLQRQIEILEAEAHAYEDALGHSGSETASAAPVKLGNGAQTPPRPGRFQPAPHWVRVISILERAGRQFTTDDVMHALASVGQKKIGRATVRSKLAELVEDNKLVRVSPGVFLLAPRGVSGDEMRAAGVIPPQARLVGEDA